MSHTTAPAVESQLVPGDQFAHRHIGPSASEADAMLAAVGASSIDALMEQAIPPAIRLRRPLELPPPVTEHQYLQELRHIARENRVFRSYIGMGYYGCITPSVIQRNLFENPGWYTPYTPYQAEVAQGRLESLLNFQTMTRDLCGMDLANASLLDEPTAAAEAMMMLHRLQQGVAAKRHANRFLVVGACFPQTRDVLMSRAEPLGIQLSYVEPSGVDFASDVFAMFVQSPDDNGAILHLEPLIGAAHAAGVLVAVATDLLAATLFTPPGDYGADIVVGNSQRFGVPMGFGGPHAAFFATRDRFVRQTPGRLIGVSVDAQGRPAFRMALQTREQHIRRERATSNICTAQALLANMAAMYAVYHGPDGLTAIASRVHAFARALEADLAVLGVAQLNEVYFDTLKLRPHDGLSAKIAAIAEDARLNFRCFEDGTIGISLDETTTAHDLTDIVRVFREAVTGSAVGAREPQGGTPRQRGGVDPDAEARLRRSTPFLTHPVFNTHHSETEMMRYIRHLERKDLGLDTSMIPLGSCTMKLNAATEMRPLSWPEFAYLHPFAPASQTTGYRRIFDELERALCEITGFAAVSLQPNSGAQGELAGLLVIRAYHQDRGEAQRTVVLIPSSAHGTNPASAVMAGMRVVVVGCDEQGNVDVEELTAKAAEHRERLAALMITYPSTHGVYEEPIREICKIAHDNGGQVYMDGANMNAQVGLTSPATIGADVCHLNLHKTFAIPHGGGGPGMGPIGVAKHLAAYLPRHPYLTNGDANRMDRRIPAVAGAPWGSASILVISYGYIRMLGAEGMRRATQYAILNANYIKARLEHHYPVLFARPNGRVAHELIFDLRGFKPGGIDEQDVAKRLMDYGFHAPTVSFPVPGTLMVEPTESESKDELDHFCEAMIAIRREIEDVVQGKADPQDNVLKNAPHTAMEAVSDAWTHPYTRERAVYPLPFVREKKFWPTVGRINNPYGDRNLVCACPSTGSYLEHASAPTI